MPLIAEAAKRRASLAIGTGFRYHESRPQLVSNSDHILKAGMVIVTEPGIYAEGLGGFPWEDDAVVTESGAVRLAESRFSLV